MNWRVLAAFQFKVAEAIWKAHGHDTSAYSVHVGDLVHGRSGESGVSQHR